MLLDAADQQIVPEEHTAKETSIYEPDNFITFVADLDYNIDRGKTNRAGQASTVCPMFTYVKSCNEVMKP